MGFLEEKELAKKKKAHRDSQEGGQPGALLEMKHVSGAGLGNTGDALVDIGGGGGGGGAVGVGTLKGKNGGQDRDPLLPQVSEC